MHSVYQAFRRLDREIHVISSPLEIGDCDALVLPGVGAFDPAMNHLNKTDLVPFLKDWTCQNKPLLGICLGLQLLFESSQEGTTEGLGFLKGKICKLPNNKKERIPHMGWAPLIKKKVCPLFSEDIENNWMYFVHSFAAIPFDSNDLAATVSFGNTEVTASVWKGRLGACQFHPEKSAKAGHQLLSRWLSWLECGAEPIK